MTRRRLATALLICAGACAEEVGDGDGDPTVSGGDVRASSAVAVAPVDEGYDFCDHLPPEPPCALLCDRDALLETIPAGTCVVLVCDLTDGHTVTVHACHPPA